jgi:hypothetical protein
MFGVCVPSAALPPWVPEAVPVSPEPPGTELPVPLGVVMLEANAAASVVPFGTAGSGDAAALLCGTAESIGVV